MRIWTKRRGNSLVIFDAQSAALFEPVPWEKPLSTEIKQPRNSGYHRLFFALCARIAEGVGQDVQTIVDWFKIETQHYTLIAPSQRRNAVTDPMAEQLRALAAEVGLGHNTLHAAADLIDDLRRRLSAREKIQYKSIAFQNMDDLQFREFFNRCVMIMYEKWKIDPASVADLLVPQEWENQR